MLRTTGAWGAARVLQNKPGGDQIGTQGIWKTPFGLGLVLNVAFLMRDPKDTLGLI